jgi:uncharacterized lipoprotein YbaY
MNGTMPLQRKIRGEIAFPANAISGVAVRATIELRDVSLQDAPSRVIVSKVINDVPVGPRERVRFALDAPVLDKSRALEVRVQVDMGTTQRHAPGDFLSTVATPVAPTGDVEGLVVPVSRL